MPCFLAAFVELTDCPEATPWWSALMCAVWRPILTPTSLPTRAPPSFMSLELSLRFDLKFFWLLLPEGPWLPLAPLCATYSAFLSNCI